MELSLNHQTVTESGLPAPDGPSSPGVQNDRHLIVSGQGATEPASGERAGSDAASQTAQCLRNVQAILRAAGSDLQYVLRFGVFLVDMGELPEMNRVYAQMFGDNRPARTTVEVSKLPSKGLRVEIDCIAYRP